MKRIFVMLALTAVALTACGGGGASAAEGTAAVQTAVAELLAASQPTTAAVETAAPDEPTAAAPANTSGNLVALVNGCIPTNTLQTNATVIEVTSGDSIWVFYDNDEHEVRYIGVDAPEGDEAGAAEALALNQQLVAGKEVLLVADALDQDEYERLLRYVVVDSTLVNLELVRQGVVFASPEEPNTACDTAIENAR